MSDPERVDRFICEGIVTTQSLDGIVNIAPMGPSVPVAGGQPDWSSLILRPFDSSRTYRNLAQVPRGVFHVTDDAATLAAAAIGPVDAELRSSERVDVPRLADCCRWYEFEIVEAAGERPRETLFARIVHAGRVRDFVGFHRARHAVLEGAILATRTHLLDSDTIDAELRRLQPLVEKTATATERAAWDAIVEHCRGTGPR